MLAPAVEKTTTKPQMSDTEKLAEATDSGLLQPRLVRLLPCPFCGSEARIGQGDGWPGETVVECSNDENCRAQMSCIWGEKNETELWNARANPQPNNMKQLATLAFYAKYAGWQSYHKSMLPQVKALTRKGFLEMNEHGQARFTGKCQD